MKISEISELLKAGICTQNINMNIDVRTACSADLMSDVMAFSKDNAILLTGLVNPQVVRTCEMLDVKVIVFVRGKKPQTDMIEMAEERGIVILTTEFPLFTASGKLYNAGIIGSGE